VSAIVAVFYSLIFYRGLSKKDLLLVGFFLASFLGVINTTKQLDSDLIAYYYFYKSVGEYGFMDSLQLMGRDPFYFVFNGVCFFVLNGSWEGYIYVYTVFCYSLFFYSLYRVGEFYGVSANVIIFGYILVGLLPANFFVSANLMRQFLAFALFFLGLVNIVFYEKKGYLIIAASVLSHAFLY